MKKLRLLLTRKCTRACPGCCNKQYDLDGLMPESNFAGYDEVILTGGEPLLVPERVRLVSGLVRKQAPGAKVILYTACTDRLEDLFTLAWDGVIDGLTVSVHTSADITPELWALAALPGIFRNVSFRLNVFAEAWAAPEALDQMEDSVWTVKRDIVWLEDCPLPEGEVFRQFTEEAYNRAVDAQIGEVIRKHNLFGLLD